MRLEDVKTRADARDYIVDQCKQHGSAKRWAESVGVSPSTINSIVAGQHLPGSKVLASLGVLDRVGDRYGAYRGAPKWTKESIEMLRDIWPSGLSCSVIARKINAALGTSWTRNAVIGKAHRLGLESRPSPIKYGEGRRSRRRNRKAAEAHSKTVLAAVHESFAPDETAPGPAAPIIASAPPGKSCQWPNGDPGEPGFHFCGSREVVPGRPYCAVHCDVAYMKKPKDAAEAA